MKKPTKLKITNPVKLYLSTIGTRGGKAGLGHHHPTSEAMRYAVDCRIRQHHQKRHKSVPMVKPK